MIPLLSGIHSTAAALNAERVRMEVVSQNIANANTTRAQDGKPYRRQQVVFETELNRAKNILKMNVLMAMERQDDRLEEIARNYMTYGNLTFHKYCEKIDSVSAR